MEALYTKWWGTSLQAFAEVSAGSILGFRPVRVVQMEAADMTSSAVDRSQSTYARLAGFMFLCVDLAYLLGIFINSRFQAAGNVVETAHKIAAAEWLYRIGLSSLLVGALCTVFLAFGLYGLLQAIDHRVALAGLVFRVVE